MSGTRFKSKEQLEAWIAQNRKASAQMPATELVKQPEPIDPQIQRRILGVDTALRCTGWGIIDVRGNKMKAVDCGVIKNTPKESFSGCLRRLAAGIRELALLYKPDIAILEGAFYCRNVHTAMVLGSARGAVISVLAEQGITLYEYAPRRVKQSVCGFGDASKPQVAKLVAQFLNVNTDDLALDSTDALAMAICHAQQIAVAQGLALPEPL